MPDIKKWWKWIVAAVTVLALFMTILVYGEIILSWFLPKNPNVEFGDVFYEFADWPSQWPSSYDKWDEEQKKFFQESQHFARIGIHNTSKLPINDIKILAPTDCLYEVVFNRKDVVTHGPSDNSPIGTLPEKENLLVLLWSKRTLLPDEKITVVSDSGSVQFKPSPLISLEEIQFYRNGFYWLLATTVALATTVLLLAFWIFFSKRATIKRKPRQRKAT